MIHIDLDDFGANIEIENDNGEKQYNKTVILDTPKFVKGKSKFTGAEKGTILHKVMEKLDFNRLKVVIC